MKYITLFKNMFLPKQSTILLGRWNVVYCDKKINKKIDLSNEDHCGTCNNINYNIRMIDTKKYIFFENL